MITGEITLYKEEFPRKYSNLIQDDDFEYLPHYNLNLSQKDFDKKLENAIVDAMAAGFCIGARVKRTYGNQEDIGVIKHFVKERHAWKPYTQKMEVLHVHWLISNFESTWTHEDLILLPKETENESNSSK